MAGFGCSPRQDALRSYQANKGIPISGSVDALTAYTTLTSMIASSLLTGVRSVMMVVVAPKNYDSATRLYWYRKVERRLLDGSISAVPPAVFGVLIKLLVG